MGARRSRMLPRRRAPFSVYARERGESMPERHIVAAGGGSAESREGQKALSRYILEVSGKSTPRLAYLGTASGDCAERFGEMKTAWEELGAVPARLSLFSPHTREIREFLLDQDVIWVGGGNTRNLLVLWREWGVDRFLYEAWERGIVLAGSSAGGLCWFDSGLTDSWGPGYEPLSCLGWLAGSFCPHWDGEAERQPRYQNLLLDGTLPAGYAVDEMVGLHYAGTTLQRIVSGRPDGRAFRAAADEGRVTFEPLRVDVLPA